MQDSFSYQSSRVRYWFNLGRSLANRLPSLPGWVGDAMVKERLVAAATRMNFMMNDYFDEWDN